MALDNHAEDNFYTDEYQKIQEKFLQLYKDRPSDGAVLSLPAMRDVRDEIKNRKDELENIDKEQDIKLKKKTLYILFIFLGAETLAIFIIAFFQGFGFGDNNFKFQLEEWGFRLLIAATISQITYMLTFAVNHLFPRRRK